MESWPTLAHPMANKVGWFDLNNINCGLLGMPLGFLVIYVVSLHGKAPSKEMQAYHRRNPQAARHARCWRKRPDRVDNGNNRSGARRGPAFFGLPGKPAPVMVRR